LYCSELKEIEFLIDGCMDKWMGKYAKVLYLFYFKERFTK